MQFNQNISTINNTHWCAFEAVNQTMMTAQYASLALQIIIWIIFGMLVIKAYQREFIKNNKQIYGCLFAWIISKSDTKVGYFVKTLINIIVFFVYINKDISSNSIHFQKIFAIPFAIFDSLCTFFILTVMFLIPYYWIRNILFSIQEIPLKISEKKLIHKYFLGIKIIKFILFVRILYFLINVFIFIFEVYVMTSKISHFIMLLRPLMQSLILFLIYLAGVFLFNKLEQIINIRTKDLKILRLEYLIFMILSLAHLFLNSFAIFVVNNEIQYDNCFISHTNPYSIKMTIILYLNFTFVQFFPGILIIKTYWPTKKSQIIQSILPQTIHSQTYLPH